MYIIGFKNIKIENFIHQTFNLSDIPNNMLPKGEHKFPFAFALPRDTPASFDCELKNLL